MMTMYKDIIYGIEEVIKEKRRKISHTYVLRPLLYLSWEESVKFKIVDVSTVQRVDDKFVLF